jgi:hypothetical protein
MAANQPQITKILSDDPTLNRVQDHLASVLNPVLKQLPNKIGTKPTVSGSKGGNAALASLISALASMGLITDKTT